MVQFIFAQRSVDAKPIMFDGKPVLMYTDAAETELWGQVFSYVDQDGRERVIERRKVRDSVTGGDKLEKIGVNYVAIYVYADVYVNPKNGYLFSFPIEPDEQNQTLSRESKVGGGEARDLYLAKKFRFAKPDDVIRQRQQQRENEAIAKKRKDAVDPLKRDENLARMFAHALSQQQTMTPEGIAAAVTAAIKAEQETNRALRGKS